MARILPIFVSLLLVFTLNYHMAGFSSEKFSKYDECENEPDNENIFKVFES